MTPRRLLIVAVAIAWVGIAGCKSAHKTPPTPVPPPVSVNVSHFVGTPLSGPSAGAPASKTAANAFSAQVTFIALKQMPVIAAESVGSKARLIAVARGGVPVIATARLTQAARLITIDDADQFRDSLLTNATNSAEPLTAVRGALPGGVTATFEIAEQQSSPRFVAGQLVRRRIELDLYRPAGLDPAKTPLQLALLIEDLVTPEVISEKSDEPPGTSDPKKKNVPEKSPATRPAPLPPIVQREMAILERPPLTDHDQFAIAVPFRFGEADSRAMVAIVELHLGSADAAHERDMARCLADIQTATAMATTRPYLAPLDNPEWPGLASALQAIAERPNPRAALVFLANQTGASVCEDVALVARDDEANQLAKAIVKRVAATPAIRSKEALAWLLESATYQILVDGLATAKLAPEMVAILALHTGEAGRHPGSVDEALRATNTRQEFEVRLTAENYIFLEDSSPASRVRAYDWLFAHDRAPAGYDPLGPPKQRRVALEKALAPLTSAPAVPSKTGGTP